jgi:hypothetical protein
VEVFPWITDFIRDITELGSSDIHTPEEYCNRYGSNYWAAALRRYSVILRGRALESFQDIMPLRRAEAVARDARPCVNLSETHHYHFDLYGNYIPGMCAGLSLPSSALGKELSEKEYPIITRLFSHGVGALLEYASEEYGFTPRDSYLSECALCYDIRKHIVNTGESPVAELQPEEFYSVN